MKPQYKTQIIDRISPRHLWLKYAMGAKIDIMARFEDPIELFDTI